MEENWRVGGEGRKRATECAQCVACEEARPQHIAIREELTKPCKALGFQAQGTNRDIR